MNFLLIKNYDVKVVLFIHILFGFGMFGIPYFGFKLSVCQF